MGDRSPNRTDLFTARAGGYWTYRIPGMVLTGSGARLAYAEARCGRGGDWDPIDIVMRRSLDGGETWEAPRVLVDRRDYGGRTMHNPACLADGEAGRVHLLFCRDYARCFHMWSEDDGATFSEPVDITTTFERFRDEYDWDVIATGPGHGIRLDPGRLLVPVWLSTGGRAHRPSCASVIVSDDGGGTWERGAIVVRHADRTPNPSEPAAVQLADGRVALNIRNESPTHRRLVSVSADGAAGWTEPRFDAALFEPVCFAGLVGVPGSPPCLLFVNPDSRANPEVVHGVGRRRENLTVRASEDGGRTWPVARVLDPGTSGYADLAAGPDGAVHCFYERGGLGGNMFDPAALCVARFDLDWLKSG